MIQSVDRSVRILLALQAARRLSLSDLAARLDLPNSTVHGILRTLADHGMVEQEPGSLRYMLGPAVLRLSSVYLDSLEFRSRALKWAEELARRTGASVRAGVLLLDDVIVVHHEPRPDGSRQMPEVGFVVPAHASALGKALLAFQPRTHARPTGAAAQHDRRNHRRPRTTGRPPHRDRPHRASRPNTTRPSSVNRASPPPSSTPPAPPSAPSRSCCSPRNGRRPRRCTTTSAKPPATSPASSAHPAGRSTPSTPNPQPAPELSVDLTAPGLSGGRQVPL